MGIKKLFNNPWLPLTKGAGRALALTKGLLAVAVLTITLSLFDIAPANAASSDEPIMVDSDCQPWFVGGYPDETEIIDSSCQIDVRYYNDTAGFDVTMSSATSETALLPTKNVGSNPDKIKTVVGTLDNPVKLEINTYGYTLDMNSDKNNPIWIGLKPAGQADQIFSTDKATGRHSIDVRIGTKLNTGIIREDVYMTEVTITATAKLPPEAPTDLGGEICQSGNPDNDCQVDIDENMIPVKYTGDTTNPQWTVADPNTSGWYDYGNKQWANAVTLKDSGTMQYCVELNGSHDNLPEVITAKNNSDVLKDIKGFYWPASNSTCGSNRYMITPLAAYKAIAINTSISTSGGAAVSTTVPSGYILGYWVYAPRYDYQVRTLSGAVTTPDAQDFTIRFRKTGDSDTKWQTLTPTEAVGNSNDINNKAWATHPAFSWCTVNNDDGNKKDCTELNGIWVGKFETTGSIKAPTILPNQYHKVANVGTNYDIAKSIGIKDDSNTYGNGTTTTQNSHNLANAKTRMLKNSEWGAVAYLSSSKYGAGVNNVQLNASMDGGKDGDNRVSASITGCGPKSDGSTTTYNCSGDTTHQYQSSLGQLASTTGNIYGVYDMAGGAYEYVMGSYNRNTSQSNTMDMTTAAKPPYVNVYTIISNSSCTWLTCGGDALYETAGWGGDRTDFVSSSIPWFTRGGGWNYGSSTGLFYSSSNTGYGYYTLGFRVALLAGN